MESVHEVYPLVKNKILTAGGDYDDIADITAALEKSVQRLSTHENIVVPVSGGSDSDVVLDIVCRTCPDKTKLTFVFINTGLEFSANIAHLSYLEAKYGIQIKRIWADVSVAAAVKKYGQPVISKQVSTYMERLQSYDFQWEDLPLYDLLNRYCEKADSSNGKPPGNWFKYRGEYYRGCCSALMWWAGEKNPGHPGTSRFDITRNNPMLKEYILKHPPAFKISNLCCQYSKKDTMHKVLKESNADMCLSGVRMAESGARSSAYKSCFTHRENGPDEFRPIWYFSDRVKEIYCRAFNVTHSNVYTNYGLKRSGCVSCPYGQNRERELQAAMQYEPKMALCVKNLFKESLEWMQGYDEFRKENGSHSRKLTTNTPE